VATCLVVSRSSGGTLAPYSRQHVRGSQVRAKRKDQPALGQPVFVTVPPAGGSRGYLKEACDFCEKRRRLEALQKPQRQYYAVTYRMQVICQETPELRSLRYLPFAIMVDELTSTILFPVDWVDVRWAIGILERHWWWGMCSCRCFLGFLVLSCELL
jgi:hypothetical protein